MWDKVLMCHRHGIQALDRNLKETIQNPFQFGGKVLSLAGNFRHTLSVGPSGSGAEISSACVISSFLYHYFQTALLKENMRLEPLLQDSAAAKKAVQFLNMYSMSKNGKRQPVPATMSRCSTKFIKFTVARTSMTTSTKTQKKSTAKSIGQSTWQ